MNLGSRIGKLSAAALLPALVSLQIACAEDERRFHNEDEPEGPDDVAPYDFSDKGPWFECPAESEIPRGVVEVVPFNKTSQYYGGGENLRAVEREVELPTDTHWKQIGLMIRLECPADGRCDAWDRSASVAVIENPDDEERREEYEIARYITPYGMRMCTYVDVTPFASLLTGTRTLASYIDTWVSPGHSDGSGWRVTIRLIYYPKAEPSAPEAINIWGRRNIRVGDIDTEEGTTVRSQITPVDVAIPAHASRVEARLLATGHGFGNTGNCAEFCELTSHVIVNGTHFEVTPWRDDCAENPTGPQPGTWEYPRQAWCPGAFCLPNAIDVTGAIRAGEDNQIDYDIRLPSGEEYQDSSGGDWPYEMISLLLLVQR